MIRATPLFQYGRIVTLICLFLLPWQTRFIAWVPRVGTTESEFGVISIYVTMLLAAIAATLLFLGGLSWREVSGRALIAGWGVTFVLCGLFLLTYPSPTHAWILNILFAIMLGYATYKTTHQNARSVWLVILVSMVPVIGLGIWQMAEGWSPASTWFGLAVRNAEHLGDSVIMFHGERLLRMYGSFPHPNILGTVIALMFGALCVYMLQGGFLQEREEKKKNTSQMVVVIFCGVLISVVLWCISRSAALAMGCALISTYGYVRQKKYMIYVAYALPVVVWTLQFIAPGMLVLRGNAFSEQQSITERVAQVGEWWHVVKSQGLLGTGIYAYPSALGELKGSHMPAWAYQPVHNVFLLMFAELGIVGFGIWAWGVWMMWMKGKEKARFFFSSRVCTYPLLTVFWSLAWFDHALWTSWAGIAYGAVCSGLVFGHQASRVSTLSTRVLDESK